MDFYTSWKFLEGHKAFNEYFSLGLYVEVVKVNPVTNEIDDDATKNTKVQVWLECGTYVETNGLIHDIDLDCGGDTFEEAIIELAKLVKKYYSDDGSKIDNKNNN